MKRHTVPELGVILSIWAHPDDETYLAGGLMAAARAHGQRVVCVSASAGERGTSDPAQWPPHRLGEVRRAEAAAAMAALGVDEHHILGFADGTLEREDRSGIDAIGRLIDEVSPDTIVTFGPNGITFHPDHIAVHHWVSAAWEERARPARLLYAASTADHLRQFRRQYEDWGIYMTDLRPVGVPVDALAVQLELAGEPLERKLAALRAMPSQTGNLLTSTDAETVVACLDEETFVEATAALTTVGAATLTD